MIKVYHQLGFRENWNFEVFDKMDVGDGFIFSPVNLSQVKLEKLDSKYKVKGFLDPQCYYPEQRPKGKLLTYDYFPQNIAKTQQCTTEDFSKDGIRYKIANKCIELQLKNNFEYLVIPFNRIMSSFPNTIIQKNNEKYIYPFIEEIKKFPEASNKEILLTLIVNENQIRHLEARNEFLNWVTGIRNISGVYLIFQSDRNTKQIKNADILLGELLFIKTLIENGLKVFIGYTNTEALLYSIAFPTGVTLGSYENLRKFNEDRFIENEKAARAPIARLYSNYLLNWIPAGTINSIRSLSLDEFDKLFDKNDERPYNLSNEFNWHFTKPELYKHYFISFNKQLKELPDQLDERIKHIEGLIDKALIYYRETLIAFDSESNGDHLIIWKEVIKQFKENIEGNE